MQQLMMASYWSGFLTDGNVLHKLQKEAYLFVWMAHKSMYARWKMDKNGRGHLAYWFKNGWPFLRVGRM